MDMYGHVWRCMNIYGQLRTSADTCGQVVPLPLSSYSSYLMNIYGQLRTFADARRHARIFKTLLDSPNAPPPIGDTLNIVIMKYCQMCC